MAYTQTQLEAIEAAIASGELTVSYDGKHVSYRSIDELLRARDTIQAQLQPTSRVRYTYAQYSRGS